MQLYYHVHLAAPNTHFINVTLTAQKTPEQASLVFYLPVWSTGSYLVREYARQIRRLNAFTLSGEALTIEKITKNQWRIVWQAHQLEQVTFRIEYEVYCHENSVRTSYVNNSHAFLQGATYLLSLDPSENSLLNSPLIGFSYPLHWTMVSTALNHLSHAQMQTALNAQNLPLAPLKENCQTEYFTAINYDELLDCPVEIGTQTQTVFYVNEKKHVLAIYGEVFPHSYDLTLDVAKLVHIVANTMGEMPYNHYVFITHFMPRMYGGLEHANSTVLQFDGRKLAERKSYLQWLGLVAHEYFHTWNVKRIRPLEFSQLNHQQENYTTLLWLAEGLTSFVDDLFVLRAQLCSLTEYLELMKGTLDRYLNNLGRNYQSLADSSFDAWIKYYRPDENTANSTVSYYIKGGLVFFLLHCELNKHGKKIDDFLKLLWQFYKENPEIGISVSQVFDFIEQLTNAEVRQKVYHWVHSTEELPLEQAFHEIGITWQWQTSTTAWLGAELEQREGRIMIKTVRLNSCAAQYGLNAGDELIAINRARLNWDEAQKLESMLSVGQRYRFMVARLERLLEVDVVLGQKPPMLEKLIAVDTEKAMTVLL